jgi:NADH-quinone oxidoreductase subunit C
MSKPNIQQISDALQEKFGASIISREQAYDFPVFIVDKKELLNIIRFLYQDERFQFRFLTTLCGIHDPGAEKPYALMVQIHNLKHNVRLRFKAFAGENELTFDSLTVLFSGANWMEREAFDFYGFRFNGHPNLKRILNVDDMDYFPMRKEYPVEDRTRYDKDDTMFGRKPSGYKKLN